MTQERPPSKSRNSTARNSAARSPQNERTVARLSKPGLIVATRKIAARVSGAATACAMAGKPPAVSGALIGSGSIGCRPGGVRGILPSQCHARLASESLATSLPPLANVQPTPRMTCVPDGLDLSCDVRNVLTSFAE